MKKKPLFLLPVLAFLACAGLQAQVTIGGLTNPAAGAVLDLNSTGGVKGGLVLSNIAIDNLGKIPANELWGISSEQESNPYLRGMMVYNIGDNTPGGFYVWNGYYWTTDGNYTIVVDTISGGDPLELAVIADGCPSFTYAWYETTETSPTGGNPISGASNSTYQTPADLMGTHYYYCKVTSDYSDVEAVSDVFTVVIPCPAPAIPVSIKGFATFCGTRQTYFVEPAASGITHEWSLSSGDWDFEYGITQDTIILIRNAGAGSSVTINVTEKNDCDVSSSAKTLSVSTGTNSLGGAYEAIYATDYLNVSANTLTNNVDNYFTKIPNANLCLASSNLSNVSNWTGAVDGCKNLGDDWRLPNIAEWLKYTRTVSSSVYYWSITAYSESNAWYAIYTSSTGAPKAPSVANTTKGSGSMGARCVKTVPIP
jgi:hypothetical protein